MKTLVIGDIHGRDFWEEIIKKENPDKVIFIGDYFDSLDIPGIMQMYNFQNIIEFKKRNLDKVILLLGNHDISYWPGINGSAVTGYQANLAFDIQYLIYDNRDLLQMAYCDGTYLFSHAGVSRMWLINNRWDGETPIHEFVNDLWKYKPLSFKFDGMDPYGDDIWQTPVWIRPNSLLRSWKRIKNKPTQIVGHTKVDHIDIKNSYKWTGGKLFMIDSLGTSGEYLLIDNDELKVGKIEKDI